jgi:hypothetical protein
MYAIKKRIALNATRFSSRKNHLLREDIGTFALQQKIPDFEENGYFLPLYQLYTSANKSRQICSSQHTLCKQR